MIIRKYKCLLFEKKLTVTTHSIKVAEWKRSLHDPKRIVSDCFQNISLIDLLLFFKLYYFYRQK